jgi:hypothetical protein
VSKTGFVQTTCSCGWVGTLDVAPQQDERSVPLAELRWREFEEHLPAERLRTRGADAPSSHLV